MSVLSPSRSIVFGISCALLAAIGFSGKAILVKLAYQHGVDSVTLLALRMAMALPFFIVMAVWAQYRATTSLTRMDYAWVIALGLLGYYLSSLLDFAGLQYIPASLERLILFLYPTLTVLLSAWWDQRSISRRTWWAMGLCYGGIVLVFAMQQGVVSAHAGWGSLLVFASTLTYSLYLVGAGRMITRVGSLRFTAYASGVASFATLAQFALTRPWSSLQLSATVYGLAAWMAVLSTVLPVLLLSLAIQRIGAGRAALLGFVGPISTLGLAYWLLGETLTLAQLFGSGLVLLGVFTLSQRR